MEMLRKPEILLIAVLAIVLIGYIAYDYRKHNSHLEKIRQLEEHLSLTVRTVEGLGQRLNQFAAFGQELINLKERQEEFEEVEEKCQELVDTFDDLTEALQEHGISLDLDLPVFVTPRKGNKRNFDKKGKGRRNKRKQDKKEKSRRKRKVDTSSSDSESDASSEDEKTRALERLSKAREKKKSK